MTGNRVVFELVAALGLCLFVSVAHAGGNKGGLVLAFDDGHPEWVTIIAPELKRVGGVASGFVNNQRIHNRDLSFDDLRTLQDSYGWEIGTHTYHHFHAPEFVRRKGLPAWIREELEASVDELRAKGLQIRSLAFPFNDFNDELASAVLKRLESFRHPDVFPVAQGIRKNASYPGTPLDLARFTPLDQVVGWIDYARDNERFVFLYGHRVLPDEDFLTGVVASVSGRNIVAKELKGRLENTVDLCLVPDITSRISGQPIIVQSVEGVIIKTLGGDLSGLTRPEADFIVGNCYSMQLSYFRKLIEYAARAMTYFTVHDAVTKISLSGVPE